MFVNDMRPDSPTMVRAKAGGHGGIEVSVIPDGRHAVWRHARTFPLSPLGIRAEAPFGTMSAVDHENRNWCGRYR